ncbi:hypothetical protein JCM10213v2_000974 [Rhodosporidiobolus nylandii]
MSTPRALEHLRAEWETARYLIRPSSAHLRRRLFLTALPTRLRYLLSMKHLSEDSRLNTPTYPAASSTTGSRRAMQVCGMSSPDSTEEAGGG